MESKKIFDDFGCEILERNGVFYICFDSGESAGSSLVELQITRDEVEKAMRSEMDAYRVILEAQKRDER